LSLAIRRFWASSPQTILRGACVCLRGAPPAVHLMKKHVLHAFREVGRVAPLTNKHSNKKFSISESQLSSKDSSSYLDPKRILSSTIFPRLSQIHYERLPKSIK